MVVVVEAVATIYRYSALIYYDLFVFFSQFFSCHRIRFFSIRLIFHVVVARNTMRVFALLPLIFFSLYVTHDIFKLVVHRNAIYGVLLLDYDFFGFFRRCLIRNLETPPITQTMQKLMLKRYPRRRSSGNNLKVRNRIFQNITIKIYYIFDTARQQLQV